MTPSPLARSVLAAPDALRVLPGAEATRGLREVAVDRLSMANALIVPAPIAALCEVGRQTLFLGRWCEPVLEELSDLTYAVLPDVWEDPDVLGRAEERCWKFCLRLLPALGQRLDELHATSHGERYWELLLGSWLMHATNVVYDRYVVARAAHELAPATTVVVPDSARLAPPASGSSWHRESLDDDWNLVLFSEIFDQLNHHVRRVPAGPTAGRQTRRPSASRLARLRGAFIAESVRLAQSVALELVRHRGRERERALLSASYHFTPGDLLWLCIRTRGLTVGRNISVPAIRNWQTNVAARSTVGRLSGNDEFERLFIRLLPSLLPATVVENYSQLRTASATRWGVRTKDCIIDGNVLHDDSRPLLEYVARSADAGRRVVAIQHGGGYSFRVWPERRIEVELTDGLLSWGWTDASKAPSRVMPLPNPHLSRLRDGYVGGDRIVVTVCEYPRYMYRLLSTAAATKFPLHRATVVEYIDRLQPAIKSRVIFRKYPEDYGWGPAPASLAALAHEFPGAGTSAWTWNRRARLAVVTYPDTTFIEALALNAPTVGIWRRDLWVMHPEAQALFDSLAEAGIVHHDPASAAAHTAAVYDRAHEWWSAGNLQRARRTFLARLGLSDSDWRRQWLHFVRRFAEEVA